MERHLEHLPRLQKIPTWDRLIDSEIVGLLNETIEIRVQSLACPFNAHNKHAPATTRTLVTLVLSFDRPFVNITPMLVSWNSTTNKEMAFDSKKKAEHELWIAA